MDRLGERLARGDQVAFAELYDACADRVHHYLLVRLRSPESAAEALQETFLRLARAHKRLKRIDNLTAYVFKVARNEAARVAERKARETAKRTALRRDALFRQAASDDTQSRETADLVAAGLDRLAPEQREIVELKIHSGFTFREIAELTGLPQGTVATRYRTALGQLRRWLARELS